MSVPAALETRIAAIEAALALPALHADGTPAAASAAATDAASSAHVAALTERVAALERQLER